MTCAGEGWTEGWESDTQYMFFLLHLTLLSEPPNRPCVTGFQKGLSWMMSFKIQERNLPHPHPTPHQALLPNQEERGEFSPILLTPSWSAD